MRVTNFIAVAFFAVLIFNGNYHHNGVGMVVAATLGGEEEAFDTTTRGTMMTAVVDGESAPTRKLTKKSKASTPDANNDNMLQRLLRSLVFDKAMALYRFSMEKSQSSSVGGERELLKIPKGFCGSCYGAGAEGECCNTCDDIKQAYKRKFWELPNTANFVQCGATHEYEEHACKGCLALFEKGEQYSLDTDEQRDEFCDVVINQVMSVVNSANKSYLQTSSYNRDNVTNYCNELLQCPLRTSSTPTACCRSQGACPDPAYYCKLIDVYWFQTESKGTCDRESTALGCGTCADKDHSHTILDLAGMHDDLEKKTTKGFISYCRGGPRVWRTQKTQCMGLKYYPAITNSEDCKDACGDDYTCAVWQFDAAGARNQCWYGTNCDTTGAINAWSFGGIRRMGTDQAPDCVQPTIECASNYGTSESGDIRAKNVSPKYQCSPSKPTCLGFQYFTFKNNYGTCTGVKASPTVECASDFGSSDPCCGQGGDDVAAKYQCSQSKPICVNYVYNHHWGTCQEWS